MGRFRDDIDFQIPIVFQRDLRNRRIHHKTIYQYNKIRKIRACILCLRSKKITKLNTQKLAQMGLHQLFCRHQQFNSGIFPLTKFKGVYSIFYKCIILTFLQFQMIRKLNTRGGHREKFYHEKENEDCITYDQRTIRPPTSQPYSSYIGTKSQSQIRHKYMTNFSLETKLESHFKENKNNNRICQQIQKLPQQMKLVINQMRIFVKNKNSFESLQCEEFDRLISNFSKIIQEVFKDKESLQKKFIAEKEKNQICQEKLQNCMKLQKKQSIKQVRKSEMKQDSLETKYRQLVLQNCTISLLHAKYQERILELQSDKVDSETPLIVKNKQMSDRVDTDLLRSHNRISYLEIKLVNSEKIESDLRQKNDVSENQIKELKNQCLLLKASNQKYIEQRNQWREKAMMQKEDGEMLISRQKFLLYSLKKLKENNKNLIQKLLSISSNEEKIQRNDLIKSPNFDYELDFFRSIPKFYEREKGERFYSVKEAKKNDLGIQIEDLCMDADYHSYKKADPFDISNLKIYRPSFFSFLQESSSQDIYSCREKGSTSVSRIFIQVVRSIFNSKLNQFRYTDSIQKFSRFPQFVFGWFQRFYFNSQKCCVSSLQNFMQKPITQQNFYRDLMNVKLDQSWEIITFREFILEQLSLEQLYFYLNCQMLLYSKAGITTQVQYLGDFCIFVEYSAAKAVLDVTLNDFQSWNISFLTSKLREKLTVKRGKQFIEAGFFLRCLIEYYRIERSNRYRYISKLCNQFQGSNKGLRFSSFMSVINKFTEIPTTDKLRIYRNCYSLTKGVITPESIFIICSEQLIFLKFLKMKSFYRLPKVIQKTMKMTSSFNSRDFNQASSGFSSDIIIPNQADAHLLDVLRSFYSLVGEENGIMKRVQKMGVHEIKNYLVQVTKALDQKNSDIGSNILKCRHFVHYFFEAMEAIKKVTFFNFYDLLEEQNKKKNSNFWVQIEENDLNKFFTDEMTHVLDNYRNINKIRVWKEQVYNFRLNHAAKKIQRQVRKKFIEPYMQIYNYFSNEIRKKNGSGQV